MTNRMGPIVAVVLAVLLLPAAYLGAYYAMLEEGREIGRIQGDLAERLPNYRGDSDIVKTLFRPAHEFDRWVRPDRWAWEPAP